jgi:hypothetical protein
MRAVVNVSFGDDRFLSNHNRLEQALGQRGENLLSLREVPPNFPSHKETPFAFKAFAIDKAVRAGAQTIIWADASIVPVRPLAPLWGLIESQGYWFSENLPHGSGGAAFTNGQWTADSALEPLGITREESFTFPHVIGTAFGLDLRHEIARRFLEEYLRLAKDGTAFRGPIWNHSRQASKDPRVLGHRHDQSAASVLAWRLGMKLTRPPAWIVDGIPATEETVLEIRR